MKVSLKFATGIVLAAGLLVASGTAARAGEGGAAGSVSILFNTSTVPATPSAANVTRLSSSVAVGKGNAFATSITSVTNSTTATSAAGSGATVSLFNANSSGATLNTTIGELDVAVNQTNSFVGGTPASLKPITGVTLP